MLISKAVNSLCAGLRNPVVTANRVPKVLVATPSTSGSKDSPKAGLPRGHQKTISKVPSPLTGEG